MAATPNRQILAPQPLNQLSKQQSDIIDCLEGPMMKSFKRNELAAEEEKI